MTTPPQGPWGPGQQGGPPAPGQGGWDQAGQQPAPGWGQQPGQGGWEQPGQGWGQQPGQQPAPGWEQPGQQQAPGGWGEQERDYPQQAWGQQAPGGQWQPGQPSWQPGGARPRRGRKNKLPLIVGGAVAGVLVVALAVFLVIRALGEDDPAAGPPPATSEATTDPTTDPSTDPSAGTGAATGQAKAATDRLTGAGYQCSDLFNGPRGAHRGCFQYDETTKAEGLFQFTADGAVIAVTLRSYDSDNVNKAVSVFAEMLDAVGGAAFSGEVQKVKDAVRSGQKNTKVGTAWGEFTLLNSGDRLTLAGGRSGTDSFELPRKQFETTEDQLKAALTGKGYECSVICRKRNDDVGSQMISATGRAGGIRTLNVSASGKPAEVNSAFPGAVDDALGIVKSQDVAALRSWVKAHQDGKSHSGYVNGWRVDLEKDESSSYARLELTIQYETFYA